MRGKSNQNQEEDEYKDDEFGSRKEGTSSNVTANNNTSNTDKDGNNVDKAKAIRSKHSVTEQRRRSKINERFQILRGLIPHSDQKRDTASFLLEVIEYIQYLQEKVQKYEGSCQGWSPEPTKLMPWRNSHWRAQSIVGHPQASINGSGPRSTFAGNFDDNNMTITPTMLTCTQNLVESDSSRDAVCKTMEQQPELANKGFSLSMPLQASMSNPLRSDGVGAHSLMRPVTDAQTAECPVTDDALNQHEDLTIEEGTINVSSVYSERLLNNLTQALQDAGVDLSQANISVQIDLGKQANRAPASSPSMTQDPHNPASSNQAMAHIRSINGGEDSDQAHKRLKA